MTAFAIQENLAFADYDALIAAINDWLDREDLTGAAPQMIALAEDEIRLTVEPILLEASASIMSDDTGYASLPSDFKTIRRVFHDECSVPQRGVNAADRMTGDKTRPWAFTIERNAIRLWPAAAHTVSVLYQPKLERLSNANPANQILDEFPSLYFYGAMVFAHGYVADDERAARFRSLFDMMLERVRQFYLMQRNAGPMVARVSFVP